MSTTTAARQLQARIVAALKAVPALAGADIRSNYRGPLSGNQAQGVRVNLERTLRSKPPMLGAVSAEWQTYLQLDVLARTYAVDEDPADPLDPLLIAVFDAVAALGGPDIAAVSLLDGAAVDWQFDAADPTVAKGVLHAQIRHFASANSLTPAP